MPRGDAPAAPATSFAVRFPHAIWLKTSNSTAATSARDLHAPERSSMITAGESCAFPVLRAIPIPPRNYFSLLLSAKSECGNQAMRAHGMMSMNMAAGESRPWRLFPESFRRRMAQHLPQICPWDYPYGNTPDLWYSYNASERGQVPPVSFQMPATASPS